jgi:folate-binding protein YgfZ
MTNRILDVEIRVHRLDPSAAEVWVLVTAEHATAGTAVCGRLVGPKLPSTTTIEVAYAMQSFPKKPAELSDLARRVMIPQPNTWDAETPFVYDAVIELWQDGARCDSRAMPGLRLVPGEALRVGNAPSTYSVARTGAALFDLSARGVMELSGADCVTFLHNLCTNDIKGLPPGSGCEFFLTNHKARVVGHGFAHRQVPGAPPRLVLDVDPGTGPKVATHLDRFIVSEQVEVADRTGQWVTNHICGPQTLQLVEAIVPGIGAPGNLQSLIADGVQYTRHDRLALVGCDLIGPKSAVETIASRLVASGAVRADAETFNLLRVEAGVPLDGVDFDGERFVVEVGRIAQAISYNKGCYLGQEPIVMARDRGHANRTLLGIQIEGLESVSPGAKVFNGAEEAGQVTSSVSSPLVGSAIALAYLKRGFQTPGTKLLVEDRSAIVAALPFIASHNNHVHAVQ